MLKTIERFDTKHLPIINACLERIGVEKIIDQALNAQMWVGCGMMIKALVFDILCATRTPLYRLNQFFEVHCCLANHAPHPPLTMTTWAVS